MALEKLHVEYTRCLVLVLLLEMLVPWPLESTVVRTMLMALDERYRRPAGAGDRRFCIV